MVILSFGIEHIYLSIFVLASSDEQFEGQAYVWSFGSSYCVIYLNKELNVKKKKRAGKCIAFQLIELMLALACK